MVIVEGTVDDPVTDDDLARRIVDQRNEKYGRLVPEPARGGVYRLIPRAARAGHRFPDDATKWEFPTEG